MDDGSSTPRFADQREKIPVIFTDRFDRYCLPGGGQFNAGERAALPTEDALAAIRAGAAVRVQGIEGYDAFADKALARSPHDKMIRQAPNK